MLKQQLKVFIILFSVLAMFSCQEENNLPSSEESLDLSSPPPPGKGPKTSNQPIANGNYTIVSSHSGKVLDVAYWSSEDGGNVWQWTATNGSNQSWAFTYNSEGFYSIVSQHSSLALAVDGASLDNGGNIVQATISNGYEQQWEIVDLGNGNYRIVNRLSGKDLDVWGVSPLDGANIAQWEATGGTNQQWYFTSGAGGSANGQLDWTWVSTGVPIDAKQRIEDAMNAAVSRYNLHAPWWSRTLTVEYNTGVQTADANINGHIRFGPDPNFQNERCALHEIAHTYGVGTSWKWDTFVGEGGVFNGVNTNALIEIYDGVDANIGTGGGHFWPYGLNYNNEFSEVNADRHSEIVSAMVMDGIY
ncbi:RICIN domain-containing protein [Marinoscillum sp. MHG1-6]|uniref:RICIN domain-containing protein n=1 Tax=Marinoscillum sp. MHG1-6 TaxID=2959627 RepID=UPI0021584E73|nr:RICIN domain-containing protein [Marinoscillum sp. MHG1-6]